jgi:hypothetical protein
MFTFVVRGRAAESSSRQIGASLAETNMQQPTAKSKLNAGQAARRCADDARVRLLRVPLLTGPDCFFFRAAVLAWRDSAGLDAACRGSPLSANVVARDRAADFFFAPVLDPFLPLARSRCADLRVDSEVLPFFGGFKATPERRALESPIAMACLVDLAPCFPSRMWSISSRTNSPACVLGDFPSSLSFLARSNVDFSGIFPPFFSGMLETPRQDSRRSLWMDSDDIGLLCCLPWPWIQCD